MARDIRLIGLVAAVGLALVLVGLIVGSPVVDIEGVYFGAPGSGGSGGVFVRAAPDLLDPSDGNLWAGGGVALLLLSGLGLLARRLPWLERRRSS